MIRWLRVVIPLGYFVASLVIFLGIELFITYLEQRWGPWGFRVDPVHRLSIASVLFYSLVYGTFRIARTHPVCDRSYCDWLKATPWVRGKPLPLGPIQIVAQDLVVLLGWALPAYLLTGLSPIYPLGFFLGSYLSLATLALALTGPWPFGYLVALGLGLAALYWHEMGLCVLILIGVYLVAYLGLWRSLALFPWNEPTPNRSALVHSLSTDPKQRQQHTRLGWPYLRLSPKVDHMPSIPLRDALMSSLLVGWLGYVALSILGSQGMREGDMLGIATLVSLVFPFGRLILYCVHHHAPISFAGRILRGRWIIPGYDKVLVAPFVALLAGQSAPFLLWAGGLPMPVAAPIGITLAMLSVLLIGPSYKEWCLTGHHRIRPGLISKEIYIEVG